VTTWRSWPTFRRSTRKDGQSVEREFVWFVEQDIGLPIRRFVIDGYTGEILDEVWIDDTGRVRSYSARRSDPPDRRESSLVEAVVPAPSRSDDRVIQNGGDDGSLARQGQVRPRLPQSGCVADVPFDNRDAA
jgi:hypothetical protein